MGDIVDVDFGKSANVATRNLLSLLGKLQTYEDDVLKRPLYYLGLASKRLFDMSKILRDAEDISMSWNSVQIYRDDTPMMNDFATMVVDRREYLALKKMEKLILDATRNF